MSFIFKAKYILLRIQDKLINYLHFSEYDLVSKIVKHITCKKTCILFLLKKNPDALFEEIKWNYFFIFSIIIFYCYIA